MVTIFHLMLQRNHFFIFLLCYFLFVFNIGYSQTYYYKQIKVIQEQIEKVGNETGQFITFNPKGCYDSDKEGISVGNGFLKYIKTENNIRIYKGDSFWGEAYYYVSTDFKRINISLQNEVKIYVYTKEYSTNRTTSYYVKNNTINTIPITTTSPLETISNISNGQEMEHSKLVRTTCSFCKGTGLNPLKTYGPDYTGGSVITLQYCEICGKMDKYHQHETCPSCGGKGYTESYK